MNKEQKVWPRLNRGAAEITRKMNRLDKAQECDATEAKWNYICW